MPALVERQHAKRSPTQQRSDQVPDVTARAAAVHEHHAVRGVGGSPFLKVQTESMRVDETHSAGNNTRAAMSPIRGACDPSAPADYGEEPAVIRRTGHRL